MSGDDAKKLIKELAEVTDVIKAIPFDEVFKICDTYVKGVDECISTLNSLEADTAELKQELEDCRRQVIRLQTSTTGLRTSVERLFKFAIIDEDRYQEKVKCIERGELKL